MDLDFDFEDDKIKTFLLNKLEEIKASNDKLRHRLHERRQFLKGMIESCNMKMDESNVKITSEVWKRIFNNKYALGVTVENNDSRWNSPNPLEYQVNIYEENNDSKKTTTLCKEEICCGITNSLRKSNKIDKLAHIVIILEQPKFIDKLSHIITGNITFQQDDKEIVLMFPTIDISSLDVTNHHLNNSSLPSGEIKDILTLISCTERTDLVMMFSKEWSSSIDSTFEILCSLTKVNLSSNCKKFFIAHALSPSFDESLLEFHDSNETNKMVYHITVYSRNEDCLLSLLHHLHRNITGVVILPKMLHANYMLQQLGCISGINENLEKFNECLNREIKFVNNFLHEFQRVKNVVDDNVIKFRTDLADLEKHTDLLYVRICQLNEQ